MCRDSTLIPIYRFIALDDDSPKATLIRHNVKEAMWQKAKKELYLAHRPEEVTFRTLTLPDVKRANWETSVDSNFINVTVSNHQVWGLYGFQFNISKGRVNYICVDTAYEKHSFDPYPAYAPIGKEGDKLLYYPNLFFTMPFIFGPFSKFSITASGIGEVYPLCYILEPIQCSGC